MAGEIVHLEIPSRSFDRSASFYAKLFGWRTDGQQAGGHLLFEIPGASGGAAFTSGSLVRSALAQATGPLPFVAVDDVDATLAEAERQGGRVLARQLPLAGRGQYGLIADLDGNVIAVVAASAPGAPGEKKKTKDAPPKPPAAKAAAGGSRRPAPAARAAKPAVKPAPARKR